MTTPTAQGLPELPDLNWMQSYSKIQVREMMRDYGAVCFRAGQAAQPAAPTGDVHSCSLFCDNPACIKQQRDEMRERKALSDAELAQIMERVNFTYNPTLFARAVEAAHGIHPAGKEAG